MDAAEEPNTVVDTEKRSVVEKIIHENEKKCLVKMKQDPPYNKSGTYSVY